MFKVRVDREYVCPHCGKLLPEIKNVEVTMRKRDVVLSVGMGLGVGLFVSSAWYVTWWGALGVSLIVGVLAFLVSAVVRSRRSRVKPADEIPVALTGEETVNGKDW